ncbi:hypothetical protein H5T58_02320 [Candidatus Parcubacteria bacterium]|nr:hypothetical protein [Candidatus Parcubacteria bacterium]
MPTSSNIIYLPQDLTIKTNIFIRNVRFTAEIRLTLFADENQVLTLFEKFNRSWEIWKSEIEKTVYRTFNEIASSCSTKEEFVLAIWRSSLPEELQQLGYFLSSLTVHE